MTDSIVAGGGVSLTSDDLLLALKLSDDHAFVVDRLIQRMAAALARAEGLDVDDDDLTEALSEFYAERDLFEDEDVTRWLANLRMAEDDVKTEIRERLLSERLSDHLAPDDRIDAHFRATSHDYATAEIELIELDTAGAAAETSLQIHEGELSWQEAAGRAGGMTSDVVSRSDAPEEIASELFGADPGTLLGPVETDEGGQLLYRVIAVRDAELDDELREQIRSELVDAELRRAFARQPFEFLA